MLNGDRRIICPGRPAVERIAAVALIGLPGCALLGTLIWCATLNRTQDSLRFRCGLLATMSDPYLDGSRRLFQNCSWHLGIGTRSWGETYGVKLGRVYLNMEVSHTNPRISPEGAGENR